MSLNNSCTIKLRLVSQIPGFCGPASLRMILDYWGITVSQEKIAKLSSASKKSGTSLKGMIEAAKYFGFQVFLKDNGTIEDLRYFVGRGIPVIVNWFCKDDGHYSVVIHLNKRNIVLADPDSAPENIVERRMTIKKFFRVWFDFPGDFIKEKRNIIIRRMLVLTPFQEDFPVLGGTIK